MEERGEGGGGGGKSGGGATENETAVGFVFPPPPPPPHFDLLQGFVTGCPLPFLPPLFTTHSAPGAMFLSLMEFEGEGEAPCGAGAGAGTGTAVSKCRMCGFAVEDAALTSTGVSVCPKCGCKLSLKGTSGRQRTAPGMVGDVGSGTAGVGAGAGAGAGGRRQRRGTMPMSVGKARTAETAKTLLMDTCLGYLSLRGLPELTSFMSASAREVVDGYCRDPKDFPVVSDVGGHDSAPTPVVVDLLRACAGTLVAAADYQGNQVSLEAGCEEEGFPAERGTRLGVWHVLDFVNADAMLTATVAVAIAGPRGDIEVTSLVADDCAAYLKVALGVTAKRVEPSKMSSNRELAQRATCAAKDDGLYKKLCRMFTDQVCCAVRGSHGAFGGLGDRFRMPCFPVVREAPPGGVVGVDSPDAPGAFLVHGRTPGFPGACIIGAPVLQPKGECELSSEAEDAAQFSTAPGLTGSWFQAAVTALARVDRGCDFAFAQSPLGAACGCVVKDGAPVFTTHFMYYLYLMYLPTSGRRSMAPKTFAAAFLCIVAWMCVEPRCTPDTCKCSLAVLPEAPKLVPAPWVDMEAFWDGLTHLHWVVAAILREFDCNERFVRANITLLVEVIVCGGLGAFNPAIAANINARFPMFVPLQVHHAPV